MEVIVFDVSRYSNSIRNWGVSLVLAVMFLIVGILVFTRPGETYLGLGVLFGAMVAISGICEIFVGMGTPPQAGRGRLIATGVIELLLGILLWVTPGIMMFYLPFILGFWIMFRGYSLISVASDMIGYGVKGSGWTLALAILVVLFSFAILANPFFALGRISVWIAIALILAGCAELIYAMHLRRLKRYLTV